MRLTAAMPAVGLSKAINDRLKRWSFDLQSFSSTEDGWILTSAVSTDSVQATKLALARLVYDEAESAESSILKIDDTVVNRITSWFSDHTCLAIGGGGELEPDEAVRKWITDEIAFALLAYGSKREDPPELIGFATAHILAEHKAVEIGRLVIDPDRRYQGIGKVFISNIAQLLASISKRTPLYARVHKGNPAAIDLFDDIVQFEPAHLSESDAESLQVPRYQYDFSSFMWFVWQDTPTRSAHGVGQLFRRLREERGLTQQTVSQRAGISREALNQIENAGTPSSENVPRLLHALSLTSDVPSEAKAALLFAYFGYDVPKDIVFTNVLERSSTGASGPESRWVLSDRPGELTDWEEFSRSVEAILQGYYRYFFIPKAGLGAPYGVQLCRSLAESIVQRADNPKKAHQSLARMRLYSAPSALCRLRIVMYGAEVHNGRPTPPRGVSIAGADDERIALGTVQASRMFDDLFDAIRPSFHLDNRLSVKMPLSEGFELIPMSEIYSLED